MDFTIEPGRGIGPLTLGATPEAVRALLGEPEHEAFEDEGTELEARLWSYPAIALTFVRARRGDALDHLYTERPEATLAGVAVVGLGREALLALAARAGLGAPTEVLPNEAAFGFGRAKYSRGGTASLYAWMKDGCVASIQVQDGSF